MQPFKFLCSPLGVRFRLAESCDRMRKISPRLCGQCPGPKRIGGGKVSAAERIRLARERVREVMG